MWTYLEVLSTLRFDIIDGQIGSCISNKGRIRREKVFLVESPEGWVDLLLGQVAGGPEHDKGVLRVRYLVGSELKSCKCFIGIY
jgi:hypothetical protein